MSKISLTGSSYKIRYDKTPIIFESTFVVAQFRCSVQSEILEAIGIIKKPNNINRDVSNSLPSTWNIVIIDCPSQTRHIDRRFHISDFHGVSASGLIHKLNYRSTFHFRHIQLLKTQRISYTK